MKNFDYIAAISIDDALNHGQDGGVFFAGGTDMLPMMKREITAPATLVDIKQCDLPSGITGNGSGLRIGAMTTLAEIARNRMLGADYTVLAEAAASAATPQLRNRATLGGNLLQRPRCAYYRHRDIDCWLKGGSTCPARSGENQHHAIFNAEACCAVHPSDLAPALLALDASVSLQGSGGTRSLSLAEFYAPPDEQRRKETVIAADELIVSIDVPDLAAGTLSAYYKAMDRKVWAFALASVAAVYHPAQKSWRLALGGVAAQPVRLHKVEAHLNAANTADPGDDVLAEAARLAVADAQPLSQNGYKVTLVQRLLTKAVQALSQR